jgi:aspartate 1-decarboxylase
MLKSKIHRARITGTELNYEGSLSLDVSLMETAQLLPYEKIEVYNVNTGSRFSTYVIPAPRYSGEVRLNGAAARLGAVGDIIIIASYGLFQRGSGKIRCSQALPGRFLSHRRSPCQVLL